MKAIEAKQISNENLDTMDYVEKQIHKDVSEEAKRGKFNALVRILYPDTIDYTQYENFCKSALNALENLGYKISGQVTRFCAGLDVWISWKEAK